MTPEPISCEQSLKALATLSAAELESSRALSDHAAACPDCARVAGIVLERERSLALAIDSLAPRGDPAVIAGRAAIAAQRRGTAHLVKWILFAAMAATAWFALDSTIGTHERSVAASLKTETIRFSCLTPQQAESLIEPYVRTNGHAIYFIPGIQGVTVRAMPAEIERSKTLIHEFDLQMRAEKAGSCELPPMPKP
ncbi:MAG: hypothetical protein H0W63_07805 [Gemmatimonadaceae bacterium]|nr:hypothetical protein [Gemmatimonadaceae bacterium]